MTKLVTWSNIIAMKIERTRIHFFSDVFSAVAVLGSWLENVVAVVILLRVLAVVASYQMLEVLAFCNRERAQPPSISITVLTFLVKKKYNEEFRGVYFLTIREKTFNQISYS